MNIKMGIFIFLGGVHTQKCKKYEITMLFFQASAAPEEDVGKPVLVRQEVHHRQETEISNMNLFF